MSITTTRPGAPAPAVQPMRIVVLALCLGYFMVTLDTTVVNVALPAIRRELTTGISGLQWVVDAYILTFAALLLSGGALADLFGALGVLKAGLTIFTLSSAACGLAPSLPALVAAQALRGIGAALLVPASLALVRVAFEERRDRARAVGIWAAVAGIAAAAGPLIGGALISISGWRAVFFLNLPVGLTAIMLTARCVPKPARDCGRGLDLAGQAVAASGLLALAAALIESGGGGAAPVVIAGLALSTIAIPTLIAIERRAVAPLLPPHLFANPTLAGASIVGLLINLGFYGQLFVINLYFQQQRGASPLTAGLALLPELSMATIASALAGRLTGRIGPRRPMLTGLLLGAVGLTGLGFAGAHTPYIALVPPLLATGAGMAITMPAATAAVVETASASDAGIASGAINACRQIGTVIGVALLGALIAGPGALSQGLPVALALAATAFMTGALITFYCVDRHSPRRQQTAHR